MITVTSPPTILYTLLEGTLGVNERGRVVVLPGAILHLDCLFQKNFGQPHWSVEDLKDQNHTDSYSSGTQRAQPETLVNAHAHHHQQQQHTWTNHHHRGASHHQHHLNRKNRKQHFNANNVNNVDHSIK